MAISRFNGLVIWQVKGNEESHCLSLSAKELSTFADKSQSFTNANAMERDPPVVLRYVNLLDASHNRIKAVNGLLDMVPSVWWVNLKHNFVTTSSALTPLPSALGSLDLSNNPVTSDALHVLAHMHILRLHIDVGGTSAKDREMLALCPNVWVFNDDYYVHGERAEMEVAASNTAIGKDIANKFVGDGSLGSDENFLGFDNCVPNTPARPGGAQTDPSLTVSLDLSVGADVVGALPVEGIKTPPGPADQTDIPEGSPALRDVHPIAIPRPLSRGRLDNAAISDEVSVQSEVSQSAYAFGNWEFRSQGGREGAFLVALHTFSPTVTYPIDFYRLDVLLEDYFDEAHLANANNIPYRAVHGQRYPVVDMMQVISLPRRVKMDLTVLLTVSIIIELPKVLVVDVAIQMLVDYISVTAIKDIVRLPSFAKTALVGLMQRVLKKEEAELACYGTLIDKAQLSSHKPVVPPGPDGFVPTYTGTSEGWFHLFEVLHYLHRPMQELEKILYKACHGKSASSLPVSGSGASKKKAVAAASSISSTGSMLQKSASLGGRGAHGSDFNSLHSAGNSSQASQNAAPHGIYRFSPLEYRLLEVIPSIVTPTTPTYHAKYAQETQWINLAARYVVVLLAKSALCPSLTQAQVSIKAQGLYIELIPVLRLAKMTHSDLTDVNESGEKNGRVNVFEAVNHREARLVAQREAEVKKLASLDNIALLLEDIHANKVHKRSSLIDAGELAFGAGLPRGSASKLAWKKEGKTFEHDYDLWNDHKHLERRDLRQAQQVQLQESKKEEQRKLKGHAKNQALSPPLKEAPRYRAEGAPYLHGARMEGHVQFIGGDLNDLSMGSLSAASSIVMAGNPAYTTSHDYRDGVKVNLKLSVSMPYSLHGSIDMGEASPLASKPPPLSLFAATGEAGCKTMADAFTDDIESPLHTRSHALTGVAGFTHSMPDLPQSTIRGECIDMNNDVRVRDLSNHFTPIEGSIISQYNAPMQQVDGPLSPSNLLNVQRTKTLDNENRSPSPSPKMQRAMNSVVSPNRSIHIINGFSANAQRESSFLLAPTQVALDQNRKTGKKLSYKLSMLHQAPVMVHPKSPGIIPMPSAVPGNNKMMSVKSLPDFLGKLTYGASGSLTNQDDGSVSVESSTSDSTYTPAAAARTLLAEMGTLRNIRNLLIDDGASRNPKSPLNSRLDPFSSASQASAQYLYGDESSARDRYEGNDVFLTNTGESDRSRVSASMPNEGTYHTVASFATEKTKATSKVFKMRDLDTILTSVDLMKMKTQYNHIFTTEQVNPSKGTTNNYSKNKGYAYGGGLVGQQLGMLAEDRTVDGRPLSASWYPVPKKPVFTLAPETKDSLDATIKEMYGVIDTVDPMGNRPVSREPKIQKNANQVTYTTQKLRVRQPAGAKAPVSIPHPAAKPLKKETGLFRSNIYENNNATNASYRFAVVSTSRLAVAQQVPSLLPSDAASEVNLCTHMHPAVKTSVFYTANNYNNDDSSLEGQRENYAYVPKLGLSTKFKVKENTQLSEVGFKFSVASSK